MKALSRCITRHIPRMRGRRSRIAGVVLSVALALGAAVGVAFHDPGGGGHLVAVGPTSAVHGFPVWYEDAKGLTLELCVDPADPYCLAAPLPNPDQPISFPGNFPDESFWSTADAIMDTNGGGQAQVVLALEAAFAGGAPAAGDQISFGRVRYRVDNLQAGATYTITTPYGTDEIVAASGGANGINSTEDIGIAPGVFTGALGSRIGPFLTWDPAVGPDPPAGYVGDPAVPHKVIGSPFGTNLFRIVGPGVGEVGSPFLCAPPATDCIETDLFTVTGKISTIAGVDGPRATYSTSGAGETMIDVFARSKPLQNILVSGGGFDPTALRGDGSSYFARVAPADPTPSAITLTNTGDAPPSVKTVPVDDLVTITHAVYDTTARTLTIEAVSSDKRSSAPPTLTATGFGQLVAGSLVVDPVAVPPVDVTVTSSAGGKDTELVEVIGGAFVPIDIVANAGPDQIVQQGATVSLDGTGSTGAVSGWAWTQLSGPATVTLAGADTATPSFTAPASPGNYVFELTVTGTAGSSTDAVTITVSDVAAPVANAGPDQTVPQGTPVTLSGSGSTGASGYSWTQISGPNVALSGAATATPSFTFPVLVGQSPILVFRLTVTGPGGTDTDEVQIAAVTDTLAVSRARFQTRQGQWTVVGTATVLAGNTVTIHLGPTLGGAVLGTATVDNLGDWSFRGTGASATTISIESSRGGQLLEVPVQVRR
jgi:hypothetical protein